MIIAKSPPAKRIPLKKTSLCPFFVKEAILPITNAKAVMATTIPIANPRMYKIESYCLVKPKTGINNKKWAIPAKPCKKPMEREAKLLCFSFSL